MPLAAMLIPLIPDLVSGVLAIVNAVKDHDDTPAELKAKLDSLSADLQAVIAKVAAAELPEAR